MNQTVNWLRGRKTYLLSAWLFTGAVAALANGWGEQELAVLGGAIAALTATSRAGIAKGKTAACLMLACLLFVGCAALSHVDPNTGMTGQQQIQQATNEFAEGLPSPFNWALPSGVGLLLTILAVGGREQEARAGQ